MAHPLDRAIWNALTTRQAHLAEGGPRAWRFAPEYGVFAAASDCSPESLAALAALIPAEGSIVVGELEAPPALPGVEAEHVDIVQMIAERPRTDPAGFAWTTLADEDGPQMLALATLTQPGPFFARTHRLGRFVGVKIDGKLVAMAGERMQPTGFTEVSGVCTRPDHRGRGYASGLMRLVMAGIVARGETPFLHSYAHNTGAIALYETLGFRARGRIVMARLTRRVG